MIGPPPAAAVRTIASALAAAAIFQLRIRRPYRRRLCQAARRRSSLLLLPPSHARRRATAVAPLGPPGVPPSGSSPPSPKPRPATLRHACLLPSGRSFCSCNSLLAAAHGAAGVGRPAAAAGRGRRGRRGRRVRVVFWRAFCALTQFRRSRQRRLLIAIALIVQGLYCVSIVCMLRHLLIGLALNAPLRLEAQDV